MTTGLINVGFGANTRLSYLVQAAAGEIDTTPEWHVLPFSSSEPNVEAEQMEDDSMTGDRNMLEPRSGTVNGQIQASGKMRPGALDALLEACTQGTWADDELIVGNTRRAIAWEIYHSDTDEYIRIIDTEISELSIALSSNGDVTFSLTAIGGEELDLGVNIDTAIAGSTYVTYDDRPFYDSFNGVISIDGQPSIYFSELNPSMNNNSTPLFAVGNRYPIAVGHQKMNAEMTMTAYYQSETVKKLYQDESSVSMSIEMTNSGEVGAESHTFVYPSCKITNFGRPIGGAGELMENVTIRPYKDTGIGSSLKIERVVAPPTTTTSSQQEE